MARTSGPNPPASLILILSAAVLGAAACPELNNTAIVDPSSVLTDAGRREGPQPPRGGADAAAGAGGETDGPDPGATTTPGGTPPAGAACPAGFHQCNGLCADSTSPDTCGVSCEPCPSIREGQATCDGQKCGVSCPAGKRPCLDSCVDENAPCDDTCPAGKNSCGGICVAANSLSACGTSCSPCPFSDNGTTSCDGDKCELTCKPGYHRCGNDCLSDTSEASCGTSCSPCPIPTGGSATCDGVSCGTSCPTGTKLCAGVCIPNDRACNGDCAAGKHDCRGNCVPDIDVNSCGQSCMPCRVPANADPTCDGASCGFRCRGGFHDCDGECRNNDSVDSCGNRCTRCEANGGQAVCRNGQCDFECPGGRKCGNQCIRNDQPCNGACPGGLRACNGRCVPTDPGPCCVPGTKRCNPNGRAVQTCTDDAAWADSMACSLGCAPGASACTTCSPRAETCNGQDDDCNGRIDDNLAPIPCSPACAGNKICRPGGMVDASSCAPTDTVDRCGSSCTRCPAPPAGGTMRCQGGRCVPDCNSGTLCGGRCVSDDRICDGNCDSFRCRSTCVPIGTSCPGTRPLRLFFSDQRLDNYTAASSQGVINAQVSGYRDAGVIGHLETAGLPGTKPLFCYFDPVTGDNLVSDQGRPAGYFECNLGADGNVEGFVYQSPQAGTVALNFWINDLDRRDAHTVTDVQGDAELIAQNYRKIRTIGHVFRQARP